MWSGPRNLSTAMMYSFGARADFSVWDEPFYGAFLRATGLDHPMRAEVLKTTETDPNAVARACLAAIPDGKPNFYMKHMPHHMLAGFPYKWALSCANVHLIRHPARVVASYVKKRESPTLGDIGFRQQLEVFQRLGGTVIDSFDVRQNPERALRRLCETINLRFEEKMLSWPTGGHASDGIWAAHWYGDVHRSTGFAGPEGPLPRVTGDPAKLVEAAMPFYQALSEKKLRV